MNKKSFVLLFLSLLLLSVQMNAQLYDPVAIYLTWQRNPESTMTIQWITAKDRINDEVEYQFNGQKTWHKAVGTHDDMPEKHPYLIHRVELTDLYSDTAYIFRLGADSVSYKFHTMPTDLSTPVRFVAGGDVYHDDISLVEEMNRQAAATDPDFALVGGDIAYSASKYPFLVRLGFKGENFDRWLQWLICWKRTMITSQGYLIPMLPSIGNHDVVGGQNQTPNEAKFFHALFAMPGKQGYNVLDFGRYLSLFILDTGHTHPIKGAQTNWLSQALENRQEIPHKFALYHVGAYPSVRPFKGKLHQLVRKYWVPLFERFGLVAAFENHDHAYKRTHPILAGAINPKGVLYIGDGAWGVAKPRTPKTSQECWYIAESLPKRHVIMVTLKNDGRHFAAIDANGNIIDEYKN